jgi:hypothetical protein
VLNHIEGFPLLVQCFTAGFLVTFQFVDFFNLGRLLFPLLTENFFVLKQLVLLSFKSNFYLDCFACSGGQVVLHIVELGLLVLAVRAKVLGFFLETNLFVANALGLFLNLADLVVHVLDFLGGSVDFLCTQHAFVK